MSNRHVFGIACLILLVAGCGGPTKTTVNASISVPFELLDVGSYGTLLTLADPATGDILQGPIALTKDETTSLWIAPLEDIDKQDFLATVEIVMLDASGDLVIARASREISIPKGSPSATLTFRPSEFDTSMDDDGDDVTNVSEYLNGLNAESSDTDGDGISDYEELQGGGL